MKYYFNIKKKYYNITTMQIILIQFLSIIITMYLLTLPISLRHKTQNLYTILMNAYITSVSSATLSGFIYHDIYSSYTIFGQLVILCITLLNSIGIMTFFLCTKNILHYNLCPSYMFLMKESMSLYCFKKIVYISKFIFKISFFFILFGTFCLSFYYVSKFNYLKGIYFAFFHSVSVFSNSGIDIMGGFKPYSSLSTILKTNNLEITIIFTILTIIGGIGFITLYDIYKYKFNFKKYSLNSKISLISTFIIIIISAYLLYNFESHNLFLIHKKTKEKLLYIFFYITSPRTSGFNLIPIKKYFTFRSRLLILILMFIGGCPGSTAGGIKTTTLIISILGIFSECTYQKEIKIFNRRINKNIIRQANCVIIIHLLLVIIGGYTINILEPKLSLEQSFFEVTSALSTVGLSLKRNTLFLCTPVEIILSIYMIIGKIGCTTIFSSFNNIFINYKYKKYCEEQIFID